MAQVKGERPGKAGAIAVAAPPALPITEIRQLIFSRDTLLDAILYADRASNGWLSRAAVQGVAVRAGDGISVVVTAEREGHREWTKVELGPAQIAAAMIRYCRALKIPLPRGSQKSLEVQGDNICLKITVNLSTAPLHSRI
jgi:hypothetical protein